MLGTRTKQVFSYGRRNRRVINDRHDLFDAQDAKKSAQPSAPRELDQSFDVLATPPSRRGHGTSRKLQVVDSLPSTVSPPIPSHNRPKKRRENDQALKRRHSPGSGRRPLSSHPVNISGRSSLSGPKKKSRISGSRGTLLPQSPAVDMDIIVLDETGRRVSQERRVSKTNIQVNQRTILHPRPAAHQRPTATSVNVVADSDDDDSPLPQLQLKRRAKRWPKIMSSSDEEEVAESPIRSVSYLASPRPSNKDNTPVITDLLEPQIPRPNPATFPKSHFWVEIPSPQPPAPRSRGPPQGLSLYDSPPQPPRRKDRQLTPIRRKGPTFPIPPPSPSTTDDLDLSLEFANFTLSSTLIENSKHHDQPSHLIPLLDECGQGAPVEFSAFIESFPVHPIVRSSCSGHAVFQKIGEASYSEVFGIGDVVLKIIPIRNEERPDKIDAETPAPSDAKDVLKEIVVTRALGEMCNGFVSLLKTYVVRGKYPSLLLDLWDDYNQTKGSESVRPDMLAVSQVYAIIVLPNGGPDLEAYSFSQPVKTGWRQACSLFWQIARAVATVEELVSFEHRDLHWGQILVKNIPSDVSSRRKNASITDVWIPMDHIVHGVKATVIDLGFARMDAGAGDGSTEVRWTPFDEEIFEGEGDYQFDIYRLMHKHNGGCWADFRPLSNVMWLHYLVIKLLKSKNLRPPRKAGASTSPGFTERQCYDCLLKMENLLAHSVEEVQEHTPVAIKAGRRKMAIPVKKVIGSTSGPRCASDVLRFGERMGWV